MQVQCSGCGGVVPAADINLDRMLAKCARCNSVFDIHGQVPLAEGAGPLVRQRPRVALPKALRIVEDELVSESGIEPYRTDAAKRPRVVLERSWFQASLFFMVIFCIAWDSFLLFWYSMAFRHGAPWIMVVFPLGHLAVGVGLTYATLCGFVNRTRIAVLAGQLVIRHGPLPWKGNRVLETKDLEQLFCQENVSSKGVRSYGLAARMKSGEKVVLLKSLPEADQALYIEQLLEDRLGIVDEPVAGEFKG
jgi:hypothetical protein